MRRTVTPDSVLAAISGATAIAIGVQVGLTYLSERRAARRHQELIHAPLDLGGVDPEAADAVRRIHLRLIEGGGSQ